MAHVHLSAGGARVRPPFNSLKALELKGQHVFIDVLNHLQRPSVKEKEEPK